MQAGIESSAGCDPTRDLVRVADRGNFRQSVRHDRTPRTPPRSTMPFLTTEQLAAIPFLKIGRNVNYLPTAKVKDLFG